MRSSAASRPARVAYATSTPSCTPSGTSASGRPSSTTEIRSPLRRARCCSAAIRRRVAPARSRHQPSGRLPITLLPSTIRRRGIRARSDRSSRRAPPTTRPRRGAAGSSSASASTTSKPGRGATSTRGETRERGVACCGRAVVPSRVAHLRPLVGAHHHDVVAGGDVGDQLRVGHDHAEPRPGERQPFEHGQSRRRAAVATPRPCRARRARSRDRGDRARRVLTAASAIATCAIVGGSNDPG